jgi:hypothetical protein
MLCMLAFVACSSAGTHGVNTRDKTIPIYNQKW